MGKDFREKRYIIYDICYVIYDIEPSRLMEKCTAQVPREHQQGGGAMLHLALSMSKASSEALSECEMLGQPCHEEALCRHSLTRPYAGIL